MKIAIYGQFYNKNSLTYIDSLLDVLINKSISFYIESKFYQAILDDHPEIDPAKYKSFTTLDNTFDLLISIGGDGTILRAITFIKDLNIPIVGIGGITFENQKYAYDAGCDSVAMLDGLFNY